MGTRTLGTAATTTLTAVQYSPAPNLTTDDWRVIMAGILDDGESSVGGPAITENWRAANTKGPVPGAFHSNGLLYIPNRGVLRVIQGDFVAFDTQTGWPILVSAVAAAAAGWVHS